MKYLRLLFAILLLSVIEPYMAYSQNKKVAILEVVDREGTIGYGIKLMIRSNIASAITATPGYEGYDRVDMDQILGEHNFQRTGMVSEQQIKRLGEMTGAQYILVSEAAELAESSLFISSKILDVETAQIVNTANIQTQLSGSSINVATKSLSDELMSFKQKTFIYNDRINKKVAILDIVDQEGFMNYAMKLMIRSTIAHAVTSTPGYEGFDRSDVDRILEEQNFQRTGMVSDQQIKRLGEMTGAQYVLIAEVARIDDTNIFLTAKILDVETAKIDKTANQYLMLSLPNVKTSSSALVKDLLGWLDSSGKITEDFSASDLQLNGERAYKRGDYTTALSCFKRMIELDEGATHLALYYLGVMYLEGLGTESNFDMAISYFTKCLSFQSASTICRLIANKVIGYHNKGINEEQTLKVINVLELCSEMKPSDAKLQCNIGQMYRDVNYCSNALTWFKKSAMQDYAPAQYGLARMYRNGEGVNEDVQQYNYWLQKAADQGYQPAIDELKNRQSAKELYDTGYQLYSKKNYIGAIPFFKRSAELGYVRAQFRLGYCYKNALGVTKDYAEAVKWYRKAAEQGHASAQNNLANCYKNGQGVTKDMIKAIEWYKKAAAQGNKTAKDNLKDLGIKY